MRTMDTEKPAEIAIYTFTICINGERYGGQVPALNEGHAESMIKQIGGKLMGRLCSVISDTKICSICAEPLTVNMEHPKPVEEDDWELDDFGE